MRNAHIFIGGVNNDDYEKLQAAASKGGSFDSWSSTKEAIEGDVAYLYMGAPISAIVAQAIVLKNSEKGYYWDYEAPIGQIRLIQPSIPLNELKSLFPDWKWLNYPRGKAYVPAELTKTLESLSQGIGRLQLIQLDQLPPEIMDLASRKVLEDKHLKKTEKETLIQARLGQGRFRDDLFTFWSACAVTGLKSPQLLKASHIKPWAIADNRERLDKHNGLLLAPHLDAAFDRGLISFKDNGQILISKRFDRNDARILAIKPTLCLKTCDKRHRQYLAFHRNLHGFSQSN